MSNNSTILLRIYIFIDTAPLNLIELGGWGQNCPYDEKCCDKCQHNNNTALIIQISLFDTALIHDKGPKF